MPIVDGRMDGTEFIGPLSALPGIQKVIKKVINFVKWKDYDHSFNCSIDKKDIVRKKDKKFFFQNNIPIVTTK